MEQTPYHLDPIRRATVLEAIQEVCSHQGWELLAAHVRSSHVHAVVGAEIRPERVMSAFKTYASRGLNRLGLDEPNRKRWARHGSTRWLWKPEQISAAIQYVVAQQGDAMSVSRSGPVSHRRPLSYDRGSQACDRLLRNGPSPDYSSCSRGAALDEWRRRTDFHTPRNRSQAIDICFSGSNLFALNVFPL